MTIYPFVFLCLTIVSLTADNLDGQQWTNYFENFAAKVHDYQLAEPSREKNPFDEGFLLLANNGKKSSQTNTTLTTTCHTATSTTMSTSLVPITTEETLTNDRLRRSLNDDDVDIKSFLNIDDADEKLLEDLLKADSTVDGSGTSPEPITTSTSAPIPELTGLTGFSEFVLSLNPTDGKFLLEKFLAQLNNTPYRPTNLEEIMKLIEACNSSTTLCNIPLRFNTSDDITTLNQLFQTLENLGKDVGIGVSSVNRCGNNQTVPVTNVDACYLINLCRLCGTNPQRGICQPQKNVSRCECFADTGDSYSIYTGDFCVQTERPVKTVTPSWTPIVVGVVSAVAGLLLATTAGLLLANYLLGSKLPSISQGPLSRIWHIPRAHIPTSGTAENTQPSLNDSISETNPDSTLSDIDPTFFQNLDEQLNGNSSPLNKDYDPIHELDTIIDNEDISSLFHDASDNFQSNAEPFGVINPRIHRY